LEGKASEGVGGPQRCEKKTVTRRVVGEKSGVKRGQGEGIS